MKNHCPICESDNLTYLYETIVPTLQNRVYDQPDEAKQCAKGLIQLAHCNNCNFSFNAAFDENALIYDEHYDNAVPSRLFIDYYRSICKYLYENYDLAEGIVYDVGCGKGTFLKLLCEMYPELTGIGIDPSYEGDLNPASNLSFIRDFFSAEQVTEPPSLVLSRHVFEHIEYPKNFLKIVWEPISGYRNVPFFIEVPDFGWIVKNRTFWDLCYEHSNYFSEKSLKNMVEGDFAELRSITKGFGNQYLWVEGSFNPDNSRREKSQAEELDLSDIRDFIDSIHTAKKDITTRIITSKGEGVKIVLWGMATKGVIFSNMVDPAKELVDYCIDVNVTKQYKYTPITAHQILPSTALATEKENSVLIIVMNTVYLDEIRSDALLHVGSCRFIDAHGNNL